MLKNRATSHFNFCGCMPYLFGGHMTPKCFTRTQFVAWKKSADHAQERCSVCTDCTASYQAEMLAVARCKHEVETTNLHGETRRNRLIRIKREKAEATE